MMIRPLLLALTACALFGCAAPAPHGSVAVQTASVVVAESPSAPEVTPESSAQRGDSIPNVDVSSALMYQLMAAEVAVQRGDLGSAFAVYMKLARETRDPRLARRAAELALQGRAMAQGLDAAQVWLELAPNSNEASQTLAMLYAGSNRFDDAYPLFKAQLQAAGNAAEELARMQRALARTQNRSGAFNLIERLAQPYAQSADVKLVLANAAQASGLNARAVEEARAAVALAPDSSRAVLTAAQYLQAGDRPAALALLHDFVARNPSVSETRLAYARLLIADSKFELARAQFASLLQADPKNADLVYSMALLSMQGKLPADARTYLQRYLELIASSDADGSSAAARPAEPAYLYLAQIAEDEKQFPAALEWLRKIDGGDEFLTARVREAFVLSKMQRLDEARKLLRTVSVQSADEKTQLVLAEAQLLRDAKRYDESYKLLSQALAIAPDSVPLLYDTAMAAERLNQVAVMEKQLRRIIELKPDYAHAYNALGYSLADRNLRLPEALQLIEKARELAPDDAFILDSLGWVHFRMGDLKLAREHLQRAYDARPDAEVAVHLAEVLWTSGEHDGARKLLREVRAKEPGNPLLKSTVTRLKIGL
ncbi:MAG TPA: tetratricopeptide repeat protein [Burkholderiaceae bacterium]|nr:tetratricopeptide repeat protein [Burkholderiaceae bacterium]